MRSPYLEDILTSSRRILTLMNRNPLDLSSGSFDRNFWHFKTKDFSSAALQMGVGVLAKLWALPETEYHQNKQILKWIELGIDFTQTIQHRDGSFDEWYINERGWAGPTGYIMNSLLDCYELVSEALDKKALKKLKDVILKGILFLEKSTEGHMLANHIAIAILPLTQAKALLNLDELTPCIEKLITSLKANWHQDEGWSLEYDGADPGYQSGTLSFLGKSLKYSSNKEIKEICLKSLEFISYFAYPSGFVGGAVGSRHTVTFFYAGIECFRDTPLGARLSTFIECGLYHKKQILASDLDDHYMIYRLHELLDADYYFKKITRFKEPCLLPFEQENFKKIYEQAGLYIRKEDHKYSVIALKRGGAIRVEDTLNKKILLLDNGILTKKNDQIFSSLCFSTHGITLEKNRIIIKGILSDVTSKLFTPSKFILFRFFMLILGFHYKLAIKIKSLIKKILIFNNSRSKYEYQREIIFETKKIKIITKIEMAQGHDHVIIGGEFWTRYVPQSRHYLDEQLYHFRPYYSERNCKKNISYSHEIIW